jgi:hypothetical protein
MKKTMLALVALLGLSLAAAPAARADYYGVVVATWTAGGSATKALAFQNTSTTQSVEILRIEVANATNGSAITGGAMMFWVYASTAMTHGGTSQRLNYALSSANASLPSAISASTGPVNVAYENNTTSKGALPILRPLFVNNDEAATSLLSDTWSAEGDSFLSGAIILPAGANRGIVLEQQNLVATSVSQGVVAARIFYRIK